MIALLLAGRPFQRIGRQPHNLKVTGSNPVGEGQAPQVVSGLGRLAAGCKECAFVSLQKVNRGCNVARVSDIAVKAKFGAEQSGAQLCNQLGFSFWAPSARRLFPLGAERMPRVGCLAKVYRRFSLKTDTTSCKFDSGGSHPSFTSGKT
jgi:hypothetical protein